MNHPDTYQVACVVIGAGVVGLAIARALALKGTEVAILESCDVFGAGVSSRNSEVIHAGIYYPANSLKAKACVRGRRLLYDYLRSRGIAHRQCGKLIVATSQTQINDLARIMDRAAANGVDDLFLMNRKEACAVEPVLRASGAICSPSTGIVDSHGLMSSLLREAEGLGAALYCSTQVVRADSLKDGRTRLWCISAQESFCLEARYVVNAAGLGAPELAGKFEGLRAASLHKPYFAKGNYFKLTGRAPFSRLIYPVPEPGGLGVHLTLDLLGQARFGPDVEWVQEPNYDVDITRCDNFYDSIRAYWPDLKAGSLSPDYAGVRPKIVPQGAPDADFVISTDADHGCEGQVHLFGIESPGLTASLALGELVAGTLLGSLEPQL